MQDLDTRQNGSPTEIKQVEEDLPEGNIFSTEEIVIEEMAIDGICGVY